jgi:rod shape determining protein RodA
LGIGWLNIYSSTFSEEATSIFDTSQRYGKQLLFIGISLASIILIMALEASFYERFSSVFYIITLLLLLGLFPFGKTIAGATSWYGLGFFNLQPSELAKAATALALAKYLSDIQTDIKRRKDQLIAIGIFVLPALLIIPQPDPGSALVFFSLIFVLFREGLPLWYLGVAFVAIALFIATLMFGTVWVAIGLSLLIAVLYLLKKPSVKIPLLPVAGLYVLAMVFSLSVNFVFENVFEQRHRDRFTLWLRLEKDTDKLEEIRKTIGYNTYQSEKAIESGGVFGKGFLEGTRTKGDFVPEQDTDYIFTTVGEEWGFLGTSLVVILFTVLLLRLVQLAERQKNPFSRMYGYGVVSILLIHYFINIGMVIGVLPTIGIPLPFFSYGGSGLIGFTLLLFIFLRLDANRLREWD